MTELDLQAMRQTLEDERRQLLHLIAEVTGDLDAASDVNPDRSDLAQDYASHERDVALLAMEKEQLARVEDALKRLDAGTYGTCTGCSEPIAAERLQALPHATHCIRCQAKQELASCGKSQY